MSKIDIEATKKPLDFKLNGQAFQEFLLAKVKKKLHNLISACLF